MNGLDPEGVLWMQEPDEATSLGRAAAILVSSHLMNEMAVTADHLIVIGKGRLIAAASTADVIARGTEKSVLVRTPDAARLAELISAAGGNVARGAAVASDEPEPADGDLLTVTNMEAAKVGEIAASASVVLHELRAARLAGSAVN